jgi:hypothetical protein
LSFGNLASFNAGGATIGNSVMATSTAAAPATTPTPATPTTPTTPATPTTPTTPTTPAAESPDGYKEDKSRRLYDDHGNLTTDINAISTMVAVADAAQHKTDVVLLEEGKLTDRSISV